MSTERVEIRLTGHQLLLVHEGLEALAAYLDRLAAEASCALAQEYRWRIREIGELRKALPAKPDGHNFLGVRP